MPFPSSKFLTGFFLVTVTLSPDTFKLSNFYVQGGSGGMFSWKILKFYTLGNALSSSLRCKMGYFRYQKTLTFLLVSNNSSHNTTLLSFKQEFKKVIAILTEQNNYNAFVKIINEMKVNWIIFNSAVWFNLLGL